jgi:hypothetical protein
MVFAAIEKQPSAGRVAAFATSRRSGKGIGSRFLLIVGDNAQSSTLEAAVSFVPP